MIPIVPAEDVMPKGDMENCYKYIINYFQKNNPNPTTELVYKNGYELLVATILSAQCTDKRVNMVTPAFFEKYPNIESLAKATMQEVYEYISSVTFSGNKSEYLVKMANMIITKYHGTIPSDENRLQKLPGVGRKTANVIMATLFDKPTIAVDTHVFRVANRIGLVINAKTPLEVEEQLVTYTPNNVMSKMSHWLVLHGRDICTAKNPRCYVCGLTEVCNYYHNSIDRHIVKM